MSHITLLNLIEVLRANQQLNPPEKLNLFNEIIEAAEFNIPADKQHYKMVFEHVISSQFDEYNKAIGG